MGYEYVVYAHNQSYTVVSNWKHKAICCKMVGTGRYVELSKVKDEYRMISLVCGV